MNSSRQHSKSQLHKIGGKEPFLTLGLPPSRKQVEQLDTWIQAISNNIQHSQSEPLRTNQLLTIYQFGLLEVIRQISAQCVERGELLQRLINKYTELIIE
jgi:hypothetical protein